MKEISLEEMKKILLDIMIEFDEVCQIQGFKYSIIGGTLIGAVRHKGFIPWDDDIDVMMPRPDYERFKSYCMTNHTEFELVCNETCHHYGYMFAKLANPNTIIIDKHCDRYNIEKGVCIDIFIYDGLGNSFEYAKKLYNSTAIEREVLVAANWKHYFRSKTHSLYYEPIRLMMYIISRPIDFTRSIQSIESKYKEHDFYLSRYVGNLCSDKRTKSIIARDCFDDYIDLEFEGRIFKAFRGYETYLRSLYGDYMKLPPVEQRVTHHSFTAFWK